MCGRFTLKEELVRLMERFHIKSDFVVNHYVKRYNIAPGQHILAVINDGQQNRMGYLKWGLIPSWSKDAKVGYKMINARSEMVANKTSFKKALRKQRCLILADGFYEWQIEGTTKMPYRIEFNDQSTFAMAGLWEKWVDPKGEIVHTCSILTKEANSQMKELHDRMPVILEQKQEHIWLNRSIQNPKELQPLLDPNHNIELHIYRVQTKVNSAKEDSPELIYPIYP